MRIPGAFVALACLGVLAASPTRATAQSSRTITCESRNDAKKECFIANLDPESVTMEEPLSETVCMKGRNWDADDDKIWVKGGCRARFAYLTRSRGSSYSSNSRGTSGTITCESRNDARKECYVANLDDESVTMEEPLSETVCMKGRNWDADGNIIWVKGGCRARFSYITRSSSSGGGYGGGRGSSSGRQACIERAAREWGVTEENLEIAGSNRLDGGQTEILVKSKRTNGSCTVDSNGRIKRFSTW